MIEREPFTLGHHFEFEPTLLIEAGKSMPLDGSGYVPISIAGIKCPNQTPTFEDLGAGTISLSFDTPFGFLTQRGIRFRRSQLTDGLVLAPSDNEPSQWQVTLRTDMPVTEEDEMLFGIGIDFYADRAKYKLDSPTGLGGFWKRLFHRKVDVPTVQ
ncbi:MAG: hypothetical protein JWO47_283 [Candidatus Saccharibacteria bacterium]|nr:hypothetical protein [Candidatus Saccharibacteria bacterium]